MLKRYFIVFLIPLIITCSNTKNQNMQGVKIMDLRCELLKNPLGIDTPNPRLSWKLESSERGWMQTAYHILVASTKEKLDQNIGDLWDSGSINSNQSIHIVYNGDPLKSEMQCFWKVRVWDHNNIPSEWSKPVFWSMGLLDRSDWKAKWIGIDRPVGLDNITDTNTRLSARYLRKEFKLKKNIKHASLSISGLGLFEAYLNGQKIGDQVLAPALSEYQKHVYYITFDVTDQLKKGMNAASVVLGNGRYMPPRLDEHINGRIQNFPKLLFQLHVIYQNGRDEWLVSDPSWKLTTEGPILANNEFDGEIYDARKEMDGWNQIEFNDSQWRKAELVSEPKGQLNAQMTEPIRVTEEIRPKTIDEPKPGMYVVDMGQNMVGWVQLKVKGERGSKIKMRFAEALKENGELYLDNIRTAKVTDEYILKGEKEEIWEPKFTYHGFRYVEITGYPGKLNLSSIIGKVVHDNVQPTGQFVTSNSVINQIYKNAVWGVRGNYRSIPTDCPQRDERQGWLGDRATGSRGESYMFNIKNLYDKWLQDIEDSQTEAGSIPDVAPTYWKIYNDGVTWPVTFIILSGMLYDQFGDIKPIRDHYPAMKKWIRYMMKNYEANGIMPRDTYGDWCMPPETPNLIHSKDPNRITSGEVLGTSFFYHALELMSRFAELLSNEEDADSYRQMAEQMKKAFNEKFLEHEYIEYANNTATTNVLVLAYDLVPEEYQKKIFQNIVDKTLGENQGHISTGLVGAQWLMRVLTEYDRPDIAYQLATNTTYPSWGYMIEEGATTIWELWNGNTADPAMNSRNHVMLLGDLIIWFYENLAGIKPDPENPGFKYIVMKPVIPGDLNEVNGSYESVHGPIQSHWTLKRNTFKWDVKIPANTRAILYFPTDDSKSINESGKQAVNMNEMRFIGTEEDRSLFEIGSGSYQFEVKNISRIVQTESYTAMPSVLPKDTSVVGPNSVTVQLTCPTKNAELFYTLDGSRPTKESIQYNNPFDVTKYTIVTAKAFKKGYQDSYEGVGIIDVYYPEINGLNYAYYEGRWTKLPNFNRLKAKRQGKVHSFNLDEIKLREDYWGIKFTGFIKIPKDGKYTFVLTSDDGTRLFIDNELIVENDGIHGVMGRSNSVLLKAGKYPMQLDFFEGNYGEELTFSIRGPNLPKQKVPWSMLYFEE